MFLKTKFQLDDARAPLIEVATWGDLARPGVAATFESALVALQAGFVGGFIAVDRQQRAARIYRDALGVEGAFYSLNGQEITVSRSPFFSSKPEVDDDYILGVLGENYTDFTRTADKNCHSVPPGSFVEIKNGRVITEKWYKPSLKIEKKSLPDAIAEFRFLVRKSLENLARMHRLGLSWSGGLDSSIAALEASRLRLRIPHFTFAGKNSGAGIGEEHFAWQKTVSNENYLYEFDERLLLWDPINEPVQYYTPSYAIVRQIYRGMQDQGVSACVTGHGADDFFTLPAADAKRFIPEPIYRLGRRFRKYKFRDSSVPEGIWRAQNKKRVRNLLAREPYGMPWYQRQVYSRIFCGGSAQFAFPLMQSQAARYGIVIRPLFFNKDIFEFALRLPQSLWRQGPLGKEFVRDAYATELPEFIVGRVSAQNYRLMSCNVLAMQQETFKTYLRISGVEQRYGIQTEKLLNLTRNDLEGFGADELCKVLYCEQLLRRLR